MQGDLLCRIVVETPAHLTARQRWLKQLTTTMEARAVSHHQEEVFLLLFV